MILKNLREEVLEVNLELVRRRLVLYTFGNASGIARDEGLVVIKPSGVPYEAVKPEDLVVVSLDGKIVEGTLRPSSDLPTHLILYKAFPGIGGIAHTHSRAATAWAQTQRGIPCFGTTHADYFHGPVAANELTPAEIRSGYEANTGRAIVRRFAKLDPLRVPAVPVAGIASSSVKIRTRPCSGYEDNRASDFAAPGLFPPSSPPRSFLLNQERRSLPEEVVVLRR